MTDELLKALAAELAPIIRAAVAEADARAEQRVAELKSAVAALSEAVEALPPPAEPLTADQVAAVAQKAAADAVATLPDQTAVLLQMVADAVAALPTPEPGKSVTVDEVRPMLAGLVDEAVKALPAAEAGKPGVGVAGAMIDRNGALVVTLSDGALVPLGPVVGRSVEPHEVEALVAQKVAALPKPKDGQDGFGLEDFSAELLEDGRTIRLRFARGELVKTHDLKVPAMIYRHVHQMGMRCEPGDVVTWAGSAWHCEEETDERPGEGSKAWRLMVKKGRDALQPAKLG